MMAEDDIYHFFLDENHSAGPELVVAFSRSTWWHGCSDSSVGYAIAIVERGLVWEDYRIFTLLYHPRMTTKFLTKVIRGPNAREIILSRRKNGDSHQLARH